MTNAAQDNRLIWFNGRMLPSADALVPVMSPSAQFGLNVFEGIRGYWSDNDQELYLFRLQDHLDRLMASCRLIGIDSPHTTDEITTAIRDVLQANSYKCDIAVRATIYVGGDEGSWQSSAPTGMFIAPIAKARRNIKDQTGAKACISTWERIDDRSLPPRIKAGANYINGRHAHLEAQANGYDLPILLDRHGKVSEGAGSCLMLVRDGRLITPPKTASILESITRDTLITLATEAGIDVAERTVDRTELYISDEIFLCGSAAELIPITQIDRFQVGKGTIGPITQELLETYLSAASGGHAAWLTPMWQGA